ncbi:MAG: ABC-ATPase domain-containing protein, partial [Myxococcota bacterium]
MSIESLRHRLWNLDGKGYPAYKSIRGVHEGKEFTLHVDRVQGDPFAAPSRLRYIFPEILGFELDEPTARRSGADFVLRAIHRRLAHHRRGSGSGKSGALQLARPGQEVLERTAVVLDSNGTCEVRLKVGLPARGRRIMGNRAAELLCDEVPELLNKTLRG